MGVEPADATFWSQVRRPTPLRHYAALKRVYGTKKLATIGIDCVKQATVIARKISALTSNTIPSEVFEN